jgi:hypothetical protein
MHCMVAITGQLANDLTAEPIFLFDQLNGRPTRLRIDGIHWMIQEKMGFNLWWLMGNGNLLELVMPLESRGSIDLERIQSQQSPEGAIGMALTSFKRTEPNMSFFILLDLVKR